MKLLSRALIGLFSLCLLLAAVFFTHYYYSFHKRVLSIEQEVAVKVEAGMSFAHFVRQLQTQNLVSYPWHWLFYARVHDLDQKLPTGTHRIPAMRTQPVELLKQTMAGDFLPTHRFTLIEGWNLQQVLIAMQEHPFINLSPADVDRLLAERGDPDRYKEGQLFPDTYLYKGTVDGDHLLRQAQDAMEEKLDALWETRKADLPYRSPYEALILASIVEKEAGLDSERAKIAGVFVERLRRKMRLQADPTVIYGIKSFNGNLTKADLRTDTIYNTYTRAGLPPTPIAMPSEASLHAVMNPANEKLLYFVSKKDGSHHFSKTYQEHKKAVNHYQLGHPRKPK